MKKATWPTLSAQSSLILAADLVHITHCSRADVWGKAGSAWLCNFLELGLVVKRGSQPWALSLGPVAGVVALLWPLVPQVCPAGFSCFTLAK
eukprot:7168306-Prorocentrum_lima.AAC.1